MSRIRTAAAGGHGSRAASSLVGGTSVASAQEGPARLTQVVPMTGKTTKGNKTFTGKYTIERFIAQGQQALLRRHASPARSATRRSRRRNVRIPATVANASALPRRARPTASAAARRQHLLRSSASTLGPINLNLLGLVVRTNQIQLRIDAVPGPGNLLGNLLCGITGMLNPSGALGQHAARPARADPQRAARPLAGAPPRNSPPHRQDGARGSKDPPPY